jgi:hypothetical protein
MVRNSQVLYLGSLTDCECIDVILQYSFARCFHRLEAPDFDPSYKDASRRGVRMAQIAKHLRFLTWIVKALLWLPESITEKMGSTLRMFLIERRVCTLLTTKSRPCKC